MAGRAQTAPAKPAIALVDPADAAQWQTWTAPLGWQVIVPSAAANAGIDALVQSLEKAVLEEIQKGSADASRVYLAGRGDAAGAVFYTISRVPDRWAAAVALGGSPMPAIDSERLYAANFSNVPVLWISTGASDEALAGQLKQAGLNVEHQGDEKVPVAAVFDWLTRHVREEFPASIDCETNSPAFARCYWITPTRFDGGERNDVLPSSRIEPHLSPSLDLGGFGFKPDDAGPGILVSFLPEKYAGPLKMGDRIVALEGKPIADARQYVQLMAAATAERPVAVVVQRGKDRIRLETRIVMPKRVPSITGRVQASFDPKEREIQIISRAVIEMRVTVPPAWAPATLNWNGVVLEKLETPGCRLLRMEKKLENATACP